MFLGHPCGSLVLGHFNRSTPVATALISASDPRILCWFHFAFAVNILRLPVYSRPNYRGAEFFTGQTELRVRIDAASVF